MKRINIIIFYLSVLIPIVFLFIFVLTQFSSPNSMQNSLFSFLPGTMTPILVSYIFIIISPIVGLFIGYFFTPLFLFIHKKTIGRKLEYFIQEKEKSEKIKIRYTKLLFPALLAVNLALLMANSTYLNKLFLSENGYSSYESSFFTTFILLTIYLSITVGISIAVFTPTYFLLSAGIVFTNFEKVKYSNDPIEVRGVGTWYLFLLKGYAGIGTIFNLYILIMESSSGVTSVVATIGLIFGALSPILISFLFIPIISFIETNSGKRKGYILTSAKKMGITRSLDEVVTFKDS